MTWWVVILGVGVFYTTGHASVGEAHNLFSKGKFAEAGAALDRHLRSNPKASDAAAAMLLRGQCYLREGQKQKAESIWQSLTIKFAQSEEAAHAQSALFDYYQNEKRADLARKVSEQLVRNFPRHTQTVRVVVGLADEHFHNQQYDAARKLYESVAWGLDAGQRKRLYLSKAYSSGSGRAASFFAMAQEVFVINPAEAIPLYEAFLKEAPTSPDVNQAKTRLAVGYSKLPDPEKRNEAERLWKEVIAHGSRTDEWVLESRWYLIQLLAGPKNQWKQAIGQLDQQIQEVRPQSFRHEQALFAKAWLLWANQQWAEAAKQFQTLVDAYPAKAAHAPVQFYLKDCLAKQG